MKKEEESNRLMLYNKKNFEKRITSTTSYTLKLFYKLGAECYFAKGNYHECIPVILEALKFNPEDAEIWCLYAKVFIIKKIFNNAKPLLKKSIDLDPNYQEPKELLNIINNTIFN